MQVHKTVVRFARKEFLTPNYLRVTLKCDDIEHYKDVTLGVNNKLFIPPQGQNTVDLLTPNDNAPLTMRTYTHRDIDLTTKELIVDFAVHDGESIACRWAMNAQENDEIGLAMKTQHRDVLKPADHYLFITDMTGIPATAALVATIPTSAKITIITEVLTEEDILPEHYQADGALELHWLVNPNPETQSDLSKFSQSIIDSLPDSQFTHITAEFSTVKQLRDYLRNDKGWASKDFYACAYWQIGKKENEERQKRLD